MSAAAYTGPGWYRIRQVARVGTALSTHVVYIAPLPEDPEWPMPRPWLGVWLTREDPPFASVAIMRSQPELIASAIVERIETEAGHAASSEQVLSNC